MTAEQYPKFYLYRRLVQAKLFIDNNYFEKIDLDNIADTAFFSKYHFIRLFKRIFRKTPHQYLISVRINNAKFLLKQERTIIDICYSVGFDSVSTFMELFKRHTGFTPSAFRSHHQKLKAELLKNPLKFIPGCFRSINSNAGL